MISWIAIALAVAAAPSEVVEAGGVRIDVQVRSHIYTWTVTNEGSVDPISRFEIDLFGAGDLIAPNGWSSEIEGPRWTAWTDDARYAIVIGQSGVFSARVRSTGGVLGTVPATVGFAGAAEPIAFEAVWGPRSKRRSMVVLVALMLAGIATGHTVMLERRRRRPARVSGSGP